MPTGLSEEAAAPAPHHNSFVGLCAVLAAVCSSGFAGVYFERILKGTRPSLWLRNIQLASFSVVFGLGGAYWKDGDRIHESGFLQGYDSTVWTVVCLQAMSGLIVAVVIKCVRP